VSAWNEKKRNIRQGATLMLIGSAPKPSEWPIASVPAAVVADSSPVDASAAACDEQHSASQRCRSFEDMADADDAGADDAGEEEDEEEEDQTPREGDDKYQKDDERQFIQD